jgi:ABC-type Co2+ transport system permease subunit
MERFGEIIFFMGVIQPFITVPLIMYFLDIYKPARLVFALFVAGILFFVLTRVGIALIFSNGDLCV